MKLENIWLVSDTHFGHKRLASTKMRRPWTDDNVDRMNETLIKMWNFSILPRHIVFHLGDVTGPKAKVEDLTPLKHCFGNKHLVMGNHDTLPMSAYYKYFSKVVGCFKKGFTSPSGTEYRILFSHVPVHTCEVGVVRKNKDRKIVFNIHGHVHDMCKGPANPAMYYNACFDVSGVTPLIHALRVLMTRNTNVPKDDVFWFYEEYNNYEREYANPTDREQPGDTDTK